MHNPALCFAEDLISCVKEEHESDLTRSEWKGSSDKQCGSVMDTQWWRWKLFRLDSEFMCSEI